MRGISRRARRRLATAAVLALIHVAIIAYVSLPQRLRWSLAEDAFVTHVFFVSEPKEEVVERVTPARARSERHLAPPRTAPITPPSEPSIADAPSTSIVPPQLARPQIDWAREAEISASRQLTQDEEARRLAAPFSHDFTEPPRNRPTPQFGWSRAHTQRIEPLKNGGTLIRLNDRCVLVFAVMVLPICQIGKIPARADLFEHMDDPPVLGAPPPPP